MTLPSRRRPRVVVIGGGFAGLSAVRQLSVADVDILLIDRNGYNTFQPLLYQVATGGLNPGDVTYALRAFTSRFPNADFLRASVTGIDPERRHVSLDTGDPVEYDYLIISTGIAANYFGIPGAAKHAHTMYTRAGAIETRDHVMTALEDAARNLPGAPTPTVVVVGGGATGVEMAGSLAELRNTAIPVAYRTLDPTQVHIILVEMQDHLLAPFHPKLRTYTAKELRKRGVDLRLGASVQEVRDDAVVIKRADGELETIPAAVTVWASGISATPVVGGWGLPTGRGGRIRVGPDLRVEGYPEIFAVGDVAAQEATPLPQVAQPAIQGGRHAGVQIRRILAGAATEPFHYKDKGMMATIGRSDAVVQLPFGARFSGFLAWVAWVGLHVVTLVSNRNRFATLINLSVRYLSWPGSLNVVVGDRADNA
ncbi:MAG: NAD(P)/FAD-dependent oxidoreductase [Actinomycetota bacterium]